jgi:hypothetical protein
MNISQGSLTMVGLNTDTPQVFWNGTAITTITAVRVDWEKEEYRVKLKVFDIDPTIQAQMLASGVIVHKERRV